MRVNRQVTPHFRDTGTKFFRIRLFFMDKILKMRVRQTFEKEERLFQEIPHFQITEPWFEITVSLICNIRSSIWYRVFIKYCVFPYFFFNFLNSASSAAALVFYLPGVCTHTDIERKQSLENILKSSKKHNI